MTTDKYSRFVLTIIAVALSTIAIQQAFRPAAADNSCGSNKPCMVYNVYLDSGEWKPCYETNGRCYVVGTK